MSDDCLLDRETPVALVIAEEARWSMPLVSALQSAGWRVELARNGRTACSIAAEAPISLVLDGLSRTAGGERTARSIRAVTGPSASAPILRLQFFDRSQDDPKSTGVDAVLPADDDAQALVRSLESWRPVSLEPTRRIAAMFGAGPIAGMIERLARRLEAAISGLESGRIDKAEAHRLAGLCGTLGFGRAHAAWLDLSLGDETAIVEVRRTTRLTLSAIARGL